MMKPPRVVLDSSVIVAGLRSRLGASNRLLELVAEQRLIPLVTTALFLEYEEVLKRPEQRLATGMSEAEIAGFLGAFASAAEAVEVHFLWRPLLADPDDELVLECAVNGSAEAIVTHNTKHFMPAFRELKMAIVTPGTLLRGLKHEQEHIPVEAAELHQEGGGRAGGK